MLRHVLIAASVLAAPVVYAQSAPPPVLMISVDGMRPDYVTDAEAHGLKLPNLRRLYAEGTSASGVQGAFPSVTYPNHTTLITGVSPSIHGVVNNQIFDPEHSHAGAWFWYAPDSHATTLWHAAHAAGVVTASIGWPVTVDSADIDYNLPEYWRGTLDEQTNPDDRFLMAAVSRPAGELDRIAERTSQPYMRGNETTLAGDEIKTIYTLDIMAHHHPGFTTLHLSSLDDEEHLHGPFSPEANATLEALDSKIGRLEAAALAENPDAVVAVVSDHGFAPISQAINLYVPFVQAGLITVKAAAHGGLPQVTAWMAEPWLAGGIAAVMLHDPADTSTRDAVQAMLTKLAADPANGIAGILTHDEVVARGGFPKAAFAVLLKPGFVTGAAFSGPLVTATVDRGTHGYDPVTVPAMHASFFVAGRGIRQQRLGLIDMRQIAPSLAALLGVQMPANTGKAIALR